MFGGFSAQTRRGWLRRGLDSDFLVRVRPRHRSVVTFKAPEKSVDVFDLIKCCSLIAPEDVWRKVIHLN